MEKITESTNPGELLGEFKIGIDENEFLKLIKSPPENPEDYKLKGDFREIKYLNPSGNLKTFYSFDLESKLDGIIHHYGGGGSYSDFMILRKLNEARLRQEQKRDT